MKPALVVESVGLWQNFPCILSPWCTAERHHGRPSITNCMSHSGRSCLRNGLHPEQDRIQHLKCIRDTCCQSSDATLVCRMSR